MRSLVVFAAALGLVAIVAVGDLTADFSRPGPMAVQNGDVNGSGVIDISDPVYLLSYLFLGGPSPAPLGCEPFANVHNGDINGDTIVDVSDPIALLHHLFLGGNAPVPGCP